MRKLSEQELLDVVERAHLHGGDLGKPMLIGRHWHRLLIPDLYPDYWPSYQAIRRIEARLAKCST